MEQIFDAPEHRDASMMTSSIAVAMPTAGRWPSTILLTLVQAKDLLCVLMTVLRVITGYR